MKPVIEVKNLSFSYDGEAEALTDVSVRIYEGEKIAVLGENGAGKSTFFLNLNGVRQPESGEILLRGEPIGKKNRKKLLRNVGIVFQDADSQIVASTVKAEVAFGPLNMGLSREETEKRTYAALRQMDLEAYETRPPHALSGGEKKRVGIADILAMEVPVIIFDEPTAALDAVSADMLEQILQQLGEEGKTIVLSTHDVDFAYRFAERILVFSGGKIIGDGTPEQIFSDERLLAAARLRKPMLLTVYELLRQRGMAKERERLPKTVPELAGLLL